MDELSLSKIKVIFSDIGGVFLSNGWDHLSRKKAAEQFRFDFNEMEALHNFIYNVYEIGSISLDDYLDTILWYKPQDFKKETFKEFMLSQSVELPNLLEWAKEWKQKINIPVFAVNNEGADLNEYRIQKFELQKLFDGFFSSCNIGYRKPDPGIFNTALKIAHIKPEECLYFDDRPMLVNAAKKLGINAVLHQNFETTKNILEHFTKK